MAIIEKSDELERSALGFWPDIRPRNGISSPMLLQAYKRVSWVLSLCSILSAYKYVRSVSASALFHKSIKNHQSKTRHGPLNSNKIKFSRAVMRYCRHHVLAFLPHIHNYEYYTSHDKTTTHNWRHWCRRGEANLWIENLKGETCPTPESRRLTASEKGMRSRSKMTEEDIRLRWHSQWIVCKTLTMESMH